MDFEFETVVRLRILRPGAEIRSAFGRGTAELLRGIDELGSLSAAAKRMGMAYSKAWKSLNATETQLKIKLVSRSVPKGSELTAEGRAFLEAYARAERAAEDAAAAAMAEYAGALPDKN